MSPKRQCRDVHLSKQPLVLVLCQVRFSPIKQMAEYIPAIQEEFRRHEFPIERHRDLQQLRIDAQGVPHVASRPAWEFRTKDEEWAILVLEDSVVLQTTSYKGWENFALRLETALRCVFSKTEHDKYGLIHRLGLRYVDLVQPQEGKDYRFYLKPGFHGVTEEAFEPRSSHRLHVESLGKMRVNEVESTMVVRVLQSDEGFDFPPDLRENVPKHQPKSRVGELVTFVDMDHFIEGNFDINLEWIKKCLWRMHDHLIETFHEYVVTKEAIEVWR